MSKQTLVLLFHFGATTSWLSHGVGSLATDEKRVSETFNEYFGNTVANLNIPKTEFDSKIIEGINDAQQS